MKKIIPFVGIIIAAMVAFIIFKPKPDPKPDDPKPKPEIVTDSILTSFVFVGCNRIWWKDVQPNTSTANTNVLKNIFSHVMNSDIKTDYFFFLGDIVSGEATDSVLDSQLNYWTKDYNEGTFSDFKNSGTTMIPVPGNHEMLNQEETPLSGTTDTWMKYMGKYMPSNRDVVPNSPNDRMTYGFTDGNIGFIVLNTDTYNTVNSIGVESQIPYDWVKQQVAKYNADPAIEHIFVMGHRPFYTQCASYAMPCPPDNPTACTRDTTHQGMRDSIQSNPVWRSFEDNNVISMLSAHVHQYQRLQPNQKTYQLIAGNGGSPVHHRTPPTFFGYTRINIWASGRVEMQSEGYDAPASYLDPVDSPNWSTRDSLIDMNWYKKGAKNEAVCNCVTGE